ncbi:hypothetical protein [Candidatus Parabeggiatoa sp. HSG14]|uniref:hypothetical protein n=1 Tax=Candidatus Parabeggiatoa sp. HSG14 TaxID=3055593 RepID=UPI0025A7EF34|nr:hypothetical protein [Thiotrichales bacterium HSG14]
MYAERLILETDQAGHLKKWPKLPANKQFEVIFLVLKDVSKYKKRTPHPDIAGKIKITGDIFDSIPSSDWNLSL